MWMKPKQRTVSLSELIHMNKDERYEILRWLWLREGLRKIPLACLNNRDSLCGLDKKSRKLIFVNEEHRLIFFLAKANDVRHMEYGAADIGVVGKDTLLEEGRKCTRCLILGSWKCRKLGTSSAHDLLKHGELIRVATKYPNVAKDYFYNKKHQTVEIIKLNGSVELAPIVGLSEVIVDLVETGTTLN